MKNQHLLARSSRHGGNVGKLRFLAAFPKHDETSKYQARQSLPVPG